MTIDCASKVLSHYPQPIINLKNFFLPDEKSRWTECNGKCINSNLEPCNGTCPQNKIFCNETTTCIDVQTPCGSRCLSQKYPKYNSVGTSWKMYRDKMSCTSCHYDEWQCGMLCLKVV